MDTPGTICVEAFIASPALGVMATETPLGLDEFPNERVPLTCAEPT